MFKPLIEMIFGCQHGSLTWPQSPRRVEPDAPFNRHERPTVTCLNCGGEFEYDMQHMQVGKRIYPHRHQHPDVSPTLDRRQGA